MENIKLKIPKNSILYSLTNNRNNTIELDCDEKLFFKVVKAIFNQRRKMARNSLKSLLGDKKIDHVLLTKRPEELSIENFIEITKMIESKIN